MASSPGVASYFFDLFETNRYTLYLVLFLGALPFLKLLRFPKIPPRAALCALLALGFVLRLGWLFFSSHEPKMSYTNEGFQEVDYINVHAVQLSQGIWFHGPDGTPIARRPIGYPLLLGLFYKLFGASVEVAYGLNLALQMLTIWLVYLIGKRAFGETAGLVAALLASIYPISIYSVKMTTDENLFLPLWYAGIYLLVRDASGQRVRWAFLWYGLLFGFATMTRTHTVFMPVVVALAYWLSKRSWKRIAAAFFVTFFVMQLVNLPWVLRNYKVWKAFIPYTFSARAVYSAVNSTSTPEGGRLPQRGEPGFSEELEQATQAGDIAAMQRISNVLITRWIAEHPLEFLDLGAKRLILFVGWDRRGIWPIWYQFYDGAYDLARPLGQKARDALEEYAYVFYYILFFLYFASWGLAVKRWGTLDRPSQIALWVLGACFILYGLEHMIIYPDRKYRYPLEPLMMLVAAYLLDHLLFIFRWKKLR